MTPKTVTWKNIGSYWMLYLLLLLPLTLTLIFDYHTFINGIVHMFYRWDGNLTEEFIGMQNFKALLHDKEFLRSIIVVMQLSGVLIIIIVKLFLVLQHLH